jgi:hypothetical protein
MQFLYVSNIGLHSSQQQLSATTGRTLALNHIEVLKLLSYLQSYGG